MAKVFPEGTGVTKIFPPSLVTAVTQGNSWTERYIVKWDEEDTYSFQASGTKAIQGVDWSLGDAAKAVATTGFQIVNGQGLNMAPLTSATSEWHLASPKTAPRLYCRLKVGSNALYSSTSYTQAYAFQAIIEPTVELSANHNEYGMCLTRYDTQYYVSITRKFDSSVFSAVSPTIGPRLTRAVATVEGLINGGGEAAVNQFFEIVVFPGGTVYTSSSAATEFVEPLSATTFQKQLTTNTAITSDLDALSWDADDMYLMLYVMNEQSPTASAMSARIKKFRMLTLGT
jgi:hypothetical protein